jgi:hypothetical protein
MQESRWTIVMAVAWIAWRNLQLVRENCPEFRSECTHWIFRDWNEAVDGGTTFARREGWWLETWSQATTARLSMMEATKSLYELPATSQMSVVEAERKLWQAFSENWLVAEALDEQRRPIDIPAREWSYLKLFEDGKRDVLRYDALDRREPFADVKLKRNDLLRLWPPVAVSAPTPEPEHRVLAGFGSKPATRDRQNRPLSIKNICSPPFGGGCS